LSFNPGANAYLRNLQKGSQVYVEANFELREPLPDADPDTPQGQRQIFLRHGEIIVPLLNTFKFYQILQRQYGSLRDLQTLLLARKPHKFDHVGYDSQCDFMPILMHFKYLNLELNDCRLFNFHHSDARIGTRLHFAGNRLYLALVSIP
jgi:hypothetical protein